MAVLYGDFDIFEHYNVDQFLASLALSVVKKYGQRGIGRKLLEARFEKSRAPVKNSKIYHIKIPADSFIKSFRNRRSRRTTSLRL